MSDYTPDVTPVEQHGPVLVKRDDAWSRGGASGAKARAMFAAAEAMNAEGILSAGARISPQLERAALVAKALGVPARLHTGAGGMTGELQTAADAGATLLRHHPARMTVIKARFRADAAVYGEKNWLVVPFGMDHPEYLRQVAAQAAQLPETGWDRIVVPCGSGMTLAGIMRGLADSGRRGTEVLAVRVGGDPARVLDRYYPAWAAEVDFAESPLPYEQRAVSTRLGGIALDPHYEAKCLPFLAPGDLLWLVGIRRSCEP